MLVKGLLDGAISKVHINGLFIEEIPVTRGVCQGDPLSPLLFVITTQPLMEYLEFKLANRDINGVKIAKDLTIFHRLFADDVSIFIPGDEDSFTKLQEALHLYERASRTKLKLAKSIIIPLALPTIPQWLTDMGCSISKLGGIQKYLGAPFGLQIKRTEMYNFCLDRIIKRISGWANRLLTFTCKVLLTQHVLQSITTYYMIYTMASIITMK